MAPAKEEFPDGLLDDSCGLVATGQPALDCSLGYNHLPPVLQIPSPLLPRSHPSLGLKKKKKRFQIKIIKSIKCFSVTDFIYKMALWDTVPVW